MEKHKLRTNVKSVLQFNLSEKAKEQMLVLQGKVGLIIQTLMG